MHSIRFVSQGVVQGFLHRPERPSGEGLLLAHGAGSDANSPVLRSFAEAFAEAGFTVLRIDLPYRQRRKTGPPVSALATEDRHGIRTAARFLRGEMTGKLTIGGHSYGGRQSSLLAAEDPEAADALLLLSYPLHPPRKPGDLRTAHFQSLRAPALFVHGTRDPFGLPDEMKTALPGLAAPHELILVEGAGHELTRGTVDFAAVIAALRRLRDG